MPTYVNSGDETEYIVRVKSRSYWWLLLLLLLLLPLLLLLRFNKNVAMVAVDKNTNKNLSDVNVDFKYVDFSFIKTNPFGFFVSDTIKISGKTDENGSVLFTNVNYSLYSVIFHSKEESIVTASGGCLSADTLKPFFTGLQEYMPYKIPLEKLSVGLCFLVLDKEDGEPLPGATLKALVDGQVVEVQTSPAGLAEIPNVSRCSDLSVDASLEGFLGDTLTADVETFLQGEHNRTLRLTPQYGMVAFTVKDLETSLPVAGVLAKLVVNSKGREVVTNTDGIGKGFFENVNPKDIFHVETKRLSYFDTLTKDYKLSEYERLKDDDKIIRIRPEKNNMVFRNIDSLSNKPVDGALNKVFINSQEKGTVYSNRQGCFTIGNISANDEVKIIAEKPGFRQKIWIRKGEKITDNQRTRDVLMRYEEIRLGKPDPKRNCGVHFSGTLLSDVEVKGHISKIYQPDIYGEYVGDGKYISNQAAFPKAVQYTFDAIAIDKGTRLVLYSEPNFKGKVLLDVKGPCLINNVKWKNEGRIKDFCTKTFIPELEANYPKSSRRWSDSNMNTWDFGSCIITCD